MKLNRRDQLVLIFTIISFFLLFPKLLSGLLPYPGDLLVSFYFPWYSGHWPGYDSWTFHKEFIGSDAIRQMIPWKFLAIDMLKQGQIPLWNPYNFSGTPLLANLQSAVFHPSNLLFFILPFLLSWTIYIMAQPLMMVGFTYLYCRKSLGLNRSPSLLAGFAYATSSFMLMWFELGIIGHAIAWLPFFLYIIDSLQKKYNLRNLLLLLVASVFTVFSGHIQSVANVFIVSGVYWIYKIYGQKDKKTQYKHLITIALWGVSTVLIAAIQLVPAIELQNLSPMSEGFAKEVFLDLQTPWRNILTFLSPDYFGHPTTGNYTSEIYGDGTPFFGVGSIIFAVFAFLFVKGKTSRFYKWLFAVYFFYGFPGPIFQLARVANIPIFSQTLSARSFFVLIFAGSILAALGLDQIIRNYKNNSQKKLIKLFIAFASIYALLFIGNLIISKTTGFFGIGQSEARTAFRNLIIPIAIFSVLFVTYFLTIYKNQGKNFFITAILLSHIFFASYQINKTVPFSPSSFFYPDHLVIDNLKRITVYDRFFGVDTASFGTNFATYYKIFSPTGYDSLRVKRYAELVAGQITGELPEKYSKSDADFIGKDDYRSRRILSLLSNKYFLDKYDDETTDWNPDSLKFHHLANLVWQEKIFKIYERPASLPRAYLTHQYQHIEDPKTIIKTLYTEEFDYKNTVILEESLPDNLTLSTESTGSAEIISYEPNKVEIKTKTNGNLLLTLTDVEFPGWKAYINGNETKIYRSNYALRTVFLPEGDNVVTFMYQPKSFQVGLYISIATTSILLIAFVYSFTSKKIEW